MIFTCPMIVAAFTESYMLAAVLTGLTVLGFQGLAEVACELESPFSSHSNELPLNMLHHHFNRQLEGLLCPAYISHNYSILTDASSESFDEEQDESEKPAKSSVTPPRAEPVFVAEVSYASGR